ncbi:DUF4097 family beta strand repeat-containing protein [Actinomadura hibisca]|uniref:DUF4097 family beta strand repeat-containing protein n=1 Tax=Actinomadura hibisca TaxID=68565 RepID=UPI000831EEA8|nr:DUF4097 family beta strand repeat-containing protein [Actinomadura hibisca]
MNKRIGATAPAVVLTLGALAGCGGLDVGTGSSERSYEITDAITELKVAGHGDIEIVGTDDRRVTVHERLGWSNRNNKPSTGHAVTGGVLKITGRCGRTVLGISRCDLSHQVRVPRGTPVEVDANDGKVTVSGLTGPVRLHNDAGRVTARDLRSPSLKVRNNDGRIDVAGQVTTVELTAGTGNISADRLRAERVTAKSGDGSLSLLFLTPPTDLKAHTGTGSINVLLPNTTGYAITAKTRDSPKRIDPALRRDDRSRYRVDVSSNDGGVKVGPA